MSDDTLGQAGPNTMARFVEYINTNKAVRLLLLDVASGEALAKLVREHAAAARVEPEFAEEFARSIEMFDGVASGAEVIGALCGTIAATNDRIAAKLVAARGAEYRLESGPDGLAVAVPEGRDCPSDPLRR